MAKGGYLMDVDVTRRTLLVSALAGAAGLATVGGAAMAGDRAPAKRAEAVPATFAFSTWGTWQFYYDGFRMMQKAYPKYAHVRWVNEQSPSSTITTQRLQDGWVARDWNSMPDVVEVDPTTVSLLASSGLIVDLTDRMRPYVSDLSPGVVRDVTWNGRIWAAPWMPNTSMIYYRKDVWDEAGVKAEDIKLWSDFQAAGEVVTRHKYRGGVKRYMTYMNVPTPTFHFDLVTQQGANMIDPATGKLLFATDPRFERAFATMTKWMTSGIALRMEGWVAPWYHALAEGIISSYVAEDWMDQILKENMPRTAGKWRTMEYPAFTPGGGRGAIGGPAINVMVNKPNLDRELAWTFMEHSFYNMSATPALFSKWDLVPAYLPAMKSPRLNYNRPDPFFGGQNQGEEDRTIQATAFAPAFTPIFDQVLNYINTALAEAAAGKMSVRAAIASAASQAKANT